MAEEGIAEEVAEDGLRGSLPPSQETEGLLAYSFDAGPIGIQLKGKHGVVKVTMIDEGSAAAEKYVPLGAELLWIGETPVRGLDTNGVLSVLRATERPLTLLMKPPPPTPESEGMREEGGEGRDGSTTPTFRASYSGEDLVELDGQRDGTSTAGSSSKRKTRMAQSSLDGARVAYHESKHMAAVMRTSPAASCAAASSSAADDLSSSPRAPSDEDAAQAGGLVPRPGDVALTPNAVLKYKKAKVKARFATGDALLTDNHTAGGGSDGAISPNTAAEQLINEVSSAVFADDVQGAQEGWQDPKLASPPQPTSSKPAHRSRSFTSRIFGSKKKKKPA